MIRGTLTAAALVAAAVACSGDGRRDTSAGELDTTRAPAPPSAEPAPLPPMSADAVQAVVDAVNAADAQLAGLAIGKASNADVKRFAARIASAHRQKVTDRAPPLGEGPATALVAPLRDLQAAARPRLDSLLAGPEFDRAWVALQVDVHERAARRPRPGRPGRPGCGACRRSPRSRRHYAGSRGRTPGRGARVATAAAVTETPSRSRTVPTTRRWTFMTAAATLALAACGTKEGEYAKDGDTGAAAPATQQTLSPSPSMGDSTMGTARGTGKPGIAGDTLGSLGKSVGSPTTGARGADSGRRGATGAPRP
jgi:predicted outer membrane protein